MNGTSAVIAIDGPAAAGKTTVSRAVAATFGVGYVESGRTYRLLAHRALRDHVPLTDEHLLSALCNRMLAGPAMELYETDSATTKALRMPDVTRAVSLVAKLPPIRTGVTELTRKLVGMIGPAIVEGRDIGTTVFPDAVLKIFLTATPEVRAERRSRDEPNRRYQEILDEIQERDAIDATREHSPMTPADDATSIDTSLLTVDQVINKVIHQCRQAGVTAIRRPARAHRER
jgi:cytidylate kinase